MSRVYRWVFVWNKALDLNLARLTQKQPILWYEELNFWANLWKQSGKKDYGFLKELPAQVIQQKLKDLDKAFRDAFDKQQKHKQIPVFKCKGKSGDSIRYPPGFKIDQPNNRFKRHAEKLATLQRQLKNKLKFSRNWRKQPDEKIAHARHDYLHKISTAISENQAVIVVEDLKINNTKY